MTDVDAPLRSVVGDRTAKALQAGLGLRTVGDLLRHYPRRYLERGELTDLAHLVAGDNVTIQARVTGVSRRQLRPKLVKHDVVVTDGTNRLTLTFFNHRWIERTLPVGSEALFAGTVEVFRGNVTLTNPEVHVGGPEEFAGALLPVYPASAKVKTWAVRQSVAVVLDTLGELADPLPEELRGREGLLDLRSALELVHRPADLRDVSRARRRLRFDEAFVLQAVLAQRRAEQRARPATRRVPARDGVLSAFDARLPFTLTAGQSEVGEQIAADLAADSAMHRLLQGEVGSGKTMVALRAMLAVVDSGGQAALLAPTEVLAQQHHRSITAMLGPLAERGLLGGSDVGTRVALLTGSQPTATRRQALLDAASGDAGIVVGTHALLQDKVAFYDLGLVVVDEQHRFGVEQRDALRAKAGTPPHVLVMTATPIPRTVAMTVFGDLEVSTLTELPVGRSPVTTHVVPAGDKPHFLDRAWVRVREEVGAGHQAFVVCPRIGDDETGGDTDDAPGTDDGVGDDPVDDPGLGPDGPVRPPLAVLDVAPALAAGHLAGLRVVLLHGRMAPEDKDGVMLAMTRGEIDVLVSTTIVEVGVDIPNATVMVVMDADRFGVSQLHQLRGRVGRGSAAALCLLVTELPPASPAHERLDAVAATTDGFELSRIDLQTRREGDVLGASQSGRRSSLRLLSVVRDEDVIVAARREATAVVEADPSLAAHPALAQAIAALVDEERADYLEKG